MEKIRGDKDNGYWIKFESMLVTDSNGKVNLKQTSAMLEEKIGMDADEDIEVIIKRRTPFKGREE